MDLSPADYNAWKRRNGIPVGGPDDPHKQTVGTRLLFGGPDPHTVATVSPPTIERTSPATPHGIPYDRMLGIATEMKSQAQVPANDAPTRFLSGNASQGFVIAKQDTPRRGGRGNGPAVDACTAGRRMCVRQAERLYDANLVPQSNVLLLNCLGTEGQCRITDLEVQTLPRVRAGITFFPPSKPHGGIVIHREGQRPTYYPPAGDPLEGYRP